MAKKVLITGGTGFLGVHLSRALLKKGYKITLFDIAPLDATDLIGKLKYVKGDIRNQRSITKATEGVDYVIHAAAALPIQRTKKAIFSINLSGTENVLKASLEKKVRRLIFISTTAVYGVPKNLPEKESSPLDPIGFYGESKVLAEKLCLEYFKKGLSVNIIRPKTFLGPERLGVFQLWFEAIFTGKRVFILGDGKNHYQLLAVSDVVSAIINAMGSEASGEIFNVGAKGFQTIGQDINSVIKFAGSKSRLTGLPVLPSQAILALLEILNLSPIAAWHYKTLPVDSFVSTQKAEKFLSWKPKKTNSELLIESYSWYAEHRKDIINRKGITHRVGWNFQLLDLAKYLP